MYLSIEIFDAKGRLVKSQLLENNKGDQLIDLTRFSIGSYLVCLKADGKMLDKEMINKLK